MKYKIIKTELNNGNIIYKAFVKIDWFTWKGINRDMEVSKRDAQEHKTREEVIVAINRFNSEFLIYEGRRIKKTTSEILFNIERDCCPKF